MKKEYATHNHKSYFISQNNMTEQVEQRNVEVMARAQGYAMVRRKGCAPYVVSEKELSLQEQTT